MKSNILGLLVVGLLAGPMAVQAANVVVGNTEWRQLTDTTGFSWDQIAGVCSYTTGACSGSIGEVSFTGWTWAANTDVQALFEFLIQPAVQNFPTSTSNYYVAGSADIANAIGVSGFAPTNPLNRTTGESIWGWSRSFIQDPFIPTIEQAYAPYLVDWFEPYQSDSAQLEVLRPPGSASLTGGLGAWMYRPANPVPLPAAAWLLLSGLADLGVVARRKKG